MRKKFEDHFSDGNGRVISGATVTVYLAGTTTLATIYSSATTTSAVTGSVLTTATDGLYYFYVDAFDYDAEQRFKLVLTKSGYLSQTYDNVTVDDIVLGTYTIATNKTVSTFVKIPEGVLYSVNTGITLTFGVRPEIGPYQVFTGAGAVAFAVPTPVHTIWCCSDLTGATDQATGLQMASNAARTHSMRSSTENYIGNELIIDPGVYLTSTTIWWGQDANTHSIRSIRGYGATIKGQTSGTPIIDMLGAMDCDIKGLTLLGGTTNSPNVAILEARNSTGQSAGSHFWDSVNIYGTYTLCAVYNYSSEVNEYVNCVWQVDSTGAAEAVYIGTDTNTDATTGNVVLTSANGTIATGAKSNLDHTFRNVTMIFNNTSPSATATVAKLTGTKTISFLQRSAFVAASGHVVPAVTLGKTAIGFQCQSVSFDHAYLAESSVSAITILDGGYVNSLMINKCWSTSTTGNLLKIEGTTTTTGVDGLSFDNDFLQDGIDASGAYSDIVHADISVGSDCTFGRRISGVIRHPYYEVGSTTNPIVMTYSQPDYVNVQEIVYDGASIAQTPSLNRQYNRGEYDLNAYYHHRSAVHVQTSSNVATEIWAKHLDADNQVWSVRAHVVAAIVADGSKAKSFDLRGIFRRETGGASSVDLPAASAAGPPPTVGFLDDINPDSSTVTAVLTIDDTTDLPAGTIGERMTLVVTGIAGVPYAWTAEVSAVRAY